MKAHSTTPLAWHQMTREKIRLFLAIAGIAFANILIFMQLGFLQALFDGSTIPHRNLAADVILVNPRQETFFNPKSFSKARLYEVKKYSEVTEATPVQIGSMTWKNPISGSTRTVLVFGINPVNTTFLLPGLAREDIESLKRFRRVLFDSKSRPEFGPIKELYERNGEFDVELGGKRVEVAGVFGMGASFSADGHVITSDTTFNYLTGRKSNEINLALIRVKDGTDVKSLVNRMRAEFNNDLAVYTREQFAQVEERYWANSTGVGFIFGLGVFVGFVVGIVIVYQILHAEVADHLSEYATLKAIGYTDSALLGVLLTEGLLIGVMGFIPGVLVSFGVYALTQWATLMPISMTVTRVLMCFVLTLVMCMISAVVASRKLRMADPAQIF